MEIKIPDAGGLDANAEAITKEKMISGICGNYRDAYVSQQGVSVVLP